MSIVKKIKLALNPLLSIRCPDHPQYTGQRAPKAHDCDGCWAIYNATEGLRNATRNS